MKLCRVKKTHTHKSRNFFSEMLIFRKKSGQKSNISKTENLDFTKFRECSFFLFFLSIFFENIVNIFFQLDITSSTVNIFCRQTFWKDFILQGIVSAIRHATLWYWPTTWWLDSGWGYSQWVIYIIYLLP